MDFTADYNLNGSILKYKKLTALRGFRIFRRTTKFKKFTFGVSKHARTRRTYIKKKRKSSNVVFQQITHYWSDSYLKKRSLENFFHTMFAFTYFMPIPHVRFIYAKATHSSFIDPLTINSSSASRKTVYNTSLFQKNGLYFKAVLRHHDPAFIALNRLPAKTVGLNKLVP